MNPESMQSSLFDQIPVEIQENILFFTEKITTTILLSLTNQHWITRAFRILKRLRLDPLETHRLRNAPFDFSRIESLEIVPQGLSIDWTLEKFPIPGESKFTSLSESYGLSSLNIWFPQFGEALTSLDLRGSNHFSPISETSVDILAQSKASKTLRSLTLRNIRASSFDRKKFPNLHSFCAELSSASQNELIQAVHNMATSYPSLRHLTLSWGSQRQFEASEENDAKFFASLASFPALQTVNISNPTFQGLRFNLDAPAILDTAQKIKQFCPATLQVNFFNYAQSKFIGTLPEYLWYMQAPSALIESVESLLPPTPGSTRSIHGLLLGFSEVSFGFKTINVDKVTELIQLWLRLPHTAPLSVVDSNTGFCLLQVCLAMFPFAIVKLIAEETEKSLIKLNQFDSNAKNWSEMSPEQRSNDCSLIWATKRAGEKNLCDIIEYVASDSYPARTRALVASQTRPGSTPAWRACLEYIYNAEVFYIMLKAGALPEPLLDNKLVSFRVTLLQSLRNLEIIQLLEELISPFVTQTRLNNALDDLLDTALSRSIPNAEKVFRKLCDLGADVTRCRNNMKTIGIGALALEESEFVKIMDLCGPHDEATLVSFFMGAVTFHDASKDSSHLHKLLKYGANPTKVLLLLLEPKYDQDDVETLTGLCDLLLTYGADPCAPNTNNQTSLDLVSLFLQYYDEERDAQALEDLANVFESKGFEIPWLTAEDLEVYSNIIKEQKDHYYDGYMS